MWLNGLLTAGLFIVGLLIVGLFIVGLSSPRAGLFSLWLI